MSLVPGTTNSRHRAQAYRRAQAVYDAGIEQVNKIEELNEQRKQFPERSGSAIDLSNKMDEHGRKAHGCFQQATFHATLAAIPDLGELHALAYEDQGVYAGPPTPEELDAARVDQAPEHPEERNFLDKVNDLAEGRHASSEPTEPPRFSPEEIAYMDAQKAKVISTPAEPPLAEHLAPQTQLAHLNDGDNLSRSGWESLMYAAADYDIGKKVPPQAWLSLPQEQREAWDFVVETITVILERQGWTPPNEATDWTHSTDNQPR